MPSLSLPTTAALLAIPILLRLLKVRALPSRETIVPPSEERVVLLGASSGIGRDLAHVYTKRGARVCLVARRKDALERVREECIDLGASEAHVMAISGDLTNPRDLINVRDQVVGAWAGIDTLHILAGVPSTKTLMDLAGVPLDRYSRANRSSSARNEPAGPSLEGLETVAEEVRICGEVNYVGTTLALAAFLPTLASTSRCPALHHLSSVAALIPAPRRTIYAATKAAALMAVETCRVECETWGVRFFSLLPGTIANDFRRKSAVASRTGRDELDEGIKHDWEKLLLEPKTVVDTIIHHLSLNPTPAPLIPFWPLSLLPFLKNPPKSLVFLPWQYRAAFLFMRDTPLGWLYLEPNARRKYGLPKG